MYPRGCDFRECYLESGGQRQLFWPLSRNYSGLTQQEREDSEPRRLVSVMTSYGTEIQLKEGKTHIARILTNFSKNRATSRSNCMSSSSRPSGSKCMTSFLISLTLSMC